MRKLLKKHAVLATLGVVVVVFGAIGVFVLQNPTLPAQAADNVLRPIFGEQKTLQIESVYFGISEQAKKIKYSIVAPPDSLFQADLSLPTGSEANIDKLNLTPIPLLHHFAPLPHEGEWQTIAQPLFPQTIVTARTFVRPDPSRSYANVAIVQFDTKRLGINTVAGIRYPGGSNGMRGPGMVPTAIQSAGALVAAFNGGFQERDGHYGMVVGDQTYVPLRPNLAALVMSKDGSAKLVEYTGQTFDSNVVAVRENGPFLVHNGEITSFVEAGRDTWGRTVTNSMYTWRSGIGITKDGNLLYAVGGSLVPETLARALQMAGAVDAIQLDINPVWVRCFFYTPTGGGSYTFKPLIRDIKYGGSAYLNGYEKDFFYIYKK